MLQTIIKIDLCGSKLFYDKNKFLKPDIRSFTLQKLKEVVQTIYPAADSQFPKGSLYALQGDCAYLILEKPTVALRATVDFMKAWYTINTDLPDCRAILDYGNIDKIDASGRLELISESLENINAIEKYFGAGEIGVTSEVFKRVDNTLIQFIKRRDVEITKERLVSIAQANYENPRLLSDSSLVHALFVASPVGDSVREKAFEALLIEALISKNPAEMNLNEFNSWLTSKSCPTIDQYSIERLLKNSKYVTINASDSFQMREGVMTSINKIKERFDSCRALTIKAVVDGMSKALGVSQDLVSNKLEIEVMLEEYLCAVFLEIRFMANYFKSTDTLFERLSDVSEFDYILRKHLSTLLQSKQERFILVKSQFLETLQKIVSKDNVYTASIFHNVLMLYYLNRNHNYIQTQLNKIRQKIIYLDTNTLYALRCNASPFHDMIVYAAKRLQSIGTKICIFERSLKEYTDSINAALAKYNHKKGFEFYFQNDQTWIWKEYEKNPNTYSNSFEYCVATHQLIPNKNFNGKSISFMDIELVELKPYLNQNELEDVYIDVFHAKQKYNAKTGLLETPYNESVYHEKVLHDSNCLNILKCQGSNPFECPKLFVTCDFRLSKVRRCSPGEYEYLVTITEFYEFILPYLFLSDAISQNPVELPNFLLASAITIDLSNTHNFDSIVGNFLVSKDDASQNYEVLSEIKNTERFKTIKNKYKALQGLDESEITAETIQNTILDIATAIQEYKASVAEKLTTSIAQETITEKGELIAKLKQKNEELEFELKKYKRKDEKRKHYNAKQQRKNKRMKLHNI